MPRASLAVVIQMTWLASIATSANSSVKLCAVSCSSRLYRAPSGSYCASPLALSISSTTMTGLAYSPSTRASNTLPGRAPFHCADDPDSNQPAVMELIGSRFMPVPSNSARWRAKWVLPMPGGPSSSMGVTSSPSLLSCARATWRFTSSSTSVKLGSSSYRPLMSGTPDGLTWKRSGPRSSMRSYTARRFSYSRWLPASCRRASLRSTSPG